MGWTHTSRNCQTVKDFLKDQINCTNENGTTWEVLDIAIVERTTAYIACKISRPQQDPYVCALVFLLRYMPKAQDGYDIGYKDMDESMGPYEQQCPERILKLLSSTDSKYAQVWRDACWANIARRKKLKKGAIVTLAAPIKFSDNVLRQKFRVTGPGRYLCLTSGTLCRLSKWQLQKATVEVPA